jgi:hypothetical protein
MDAYEIFQHSAMVQEAHNIFVDTILLNNACLQCYSWEIKHGQ